MRRVLICLLLVSLLLPAFGLAEGADEVITIDGVRVAFFSEDGAYLAPYESEGLLYVPVDSLGESLGLAVESDPETLAVTVGGIRTAFFGEDGGFLPAQVRDGVVYVPLAAFAASAEIGRAHV